MSAAAAAAVRINGNITLQTHLGAQKAHACAPLTGNQIRHDEIFTFEIAFSVVISFYISGTGAPAKRVCARADARRVNRVAH